MYKNKVVKTYDIYLTVDNDNFEAHKDRVATLGYIRVALCPCSPTVNKFNVV